jgi:hypothetical protein
VPSLGWADGFPAQGLILWYLRRKHSGVIDRFVANMWCSWCIVVQDSEDQDGELTDCSQESCCLANSANPWNRLAFAICLFIDIVNMLNLSFLWIPKVLKKVCVLAADEVVTYRNGERSAEFLRTSGFLYLNLKTYNGYYRSTCMICHMITSSHMLLLNVSTDIISFMQTGPLYYPWRNGRCRQVAQCKAWTRSISWLSSKIHAWFRGVGDIWEKSIDNIEEKVDDRLTR